MTRASKHRTLIALFLPTLVAMPPQGFAQEPTTDGSAIYAGQCLACHGAEATRIRAAQRKTDWGK